MNPIKHKFLLVVSLLALLTPGIAHTKKGASFGSGTFGISKPLEVKGQNRSLALLSASQADRTKIGFVKPRKDYRPEIRSTRY